MPVWIYFAIPLLALAGAVIYLWRKLVTLQESLESLTTFVTDARTTLQQAVAKIPEQVTAALDKALADYIANHPAATDIDGVTYDSLISAMQSITDDAKVILANSDVITVHIEDAKPTPPVA